MGSLVNLESVGLENLRSGVELGSQFIRVFVGSEP